MSDNPDRERVVVPPAVVEAAARARRNTPVRERGTPGRYAAGDLVIAAGETGARRVVLVTTVLGDGLIACRVAHNCPEMATDHDLIVAPAESGYPCRLVVAGELHVTIHRDQIRERVGRIGRDATEAVRLATYTDTESLDGHPGGLPLGGILDPRRRFLEHELPDVQDLAAPMIRELVWPDP